jgi:hypothetical protein
LFIASSFVEIDKPRSANDHNSGESSQRDR